MLAMSVVKTTMTVTTERIYHTYNEDIDKTNYVLTHKYVDGYRCK